MFLFLAVVINYNVTSKQGLDNPESIKNIQNFFINGKNLTTEFRIEKLIFISKSIFEKIVEINMSNEDEQNYKDLLKININSILNLCGLVLEQIPVLEQFAKEEYNKYPKLKEYIINHDYDFLQGIKKIIEDNSTSEKKEDENSEKVFQNNNINNIEENISSKEEVEKIIENTNIENTNNEPIVDHYSYNSTSEKKEDENIEENTNIENINNENIVNHYSYNSTSEKKEDENIIKSFIEIFFKKIMVLKKLFLKKLKENRNQNLYLDEELKKEESSKKEEPSILKENSDLIKKK